jgi:anti-anti-sigma factor
MDPIGPHATPTQSAPPEVVSCGLRVVHDRVGEAVVVRVIGVVDARSADGLASALETASATPPPGLLVVDLSDVEFFSVAGLGLLITTEQRCRERGLELRLVTTRGVLRALRITGLDVLFDITPTVVAAIRPWTAPGWIAPT